jgi:predicted MFS family arabinose efflux permease
VKERRVSAVLFLCLFAAQLGLIALAPVLVNVAGDLGVSTAAAGQLRTIAGLAAGFTALALPVAARRLGLRRLLLGGAAILGIGSLASAAAPSFALLAAAQVPVGIGVAVLVATATAAAAEWVSPAARTRVLSWALIGNPAAWIVGMPLIGLLGQASWRYAWLALPLTAALAVGIAVARGRVSAPAATAGGGLGAALVDPDLKRWMVAELAAYSGWIGVLVYAGALFTESYGTSPATTGVLLALAAAAFTVGNLVFRRVADTEDPRRLLVRLALAMAALVALLGAMRPGPVVSALVLDAVAFLAGGRTLVGSAYGLRVAREQRTAAMAVRAAANQFGYFVGAATGGAALAVWGYVGLGVVLGLLLVVAAATLRQPRRRRAMSPAPLRRAAAPARAR